MFRSVPFRFRSGSVGSTAVGLDRVVAALCSYPFRRTDDPIGSPRRRSRFAEGRPVSPRMLRSMRSTVLRRLPLTGGLGLLAAAAVLVLLPMPQDLVSSRRYMAAAVGATGVAATALGLLVRRRPDGTGKPKGE